MAHSTQPIPFLLYHSISDSATPGFRPWAVAPARFDEHIAFLRESGYTPLTVTETIRVFDGAAPLPEKPVVVTFDDGFADFADHAVPVLMRYAFKATLYICTGHVGGTSRWLADQGEGNRRMLSWEQVEALPDAGVECGAHTVTHPQLDTLRLDAARQEIQRSRCTLEDRLGRRVESFAYPHGYHGPRVRALVPAAGYTSACAVKHAMSSSGDDRFALARIIVHADTDVARLSRLLAGEGLRQTRSRERLATVGWRVARRSLTEGKSVVRRSKRRPEPQAMSHQQ